MQTLLHYTDNIEFTQKQHSCVVVELRLEPRVVDSEAWALTYGHIGSIF